MEHHIIRSIDGQSHPSMKEAMNGSPLERRIAQISVAVLFGLIATVSVHKFCPNFSDTLGNGRLSSGMKKLDHDRSTFAKNYVANPDALDLHEAARLFVEHEALDYAKQHPENHSFSPETFQSRTFPDFIARVGKKLHTYQQELSARKIATSDSNNSHDFGTPTVELILVAKQALYEEIGPNPHYSKSHSNIVDPIMSGNLQCRSGSRLLLLTLCEHVQNTLLPGEKLVLIYTNEHIQVGLLTANGRLLAFEMTKTGKAIQDYGLMNAVTEKMIVTDAAHDLAQCAIQQQAHHDRTVLFDTTMTHNDTQSSSRSVVSSQSCMNEVRGFSDGTVRIPDGIIPIEHSDAISSTTIEALHEAQHATIAPDQYTQEEYRVIREYTAHTEVLFSELAKIEEARDRITSFHSGANVQVDLAIELEKIQAHIQTMHDYAEQHSFHRIEQAYVEAKRSFSRRNNRVTFLSASPFYYLDSLKKDLIHEGLIQQ